MKPDASTFGVAWLCDQTGLVLKVLHNELGLAEADVLGRAFPQLVHLSGLQKALSFLVELRARGSLFDWEMDMQLGGRMLLIHCAGVVLDDKLLIMAARTHKDVHHLFDEMMRINNEQSKRLREITKERVEQARERGQPENDIRHYDELMRLNNDLVTLQRELTRKNMELEKLYAEVQRLSVMDSLTGLYNRRGFFELSHREVDRAKRFGGSLPVIMLDIDHFKDINDTHGHEAGDQVLEKLAGRLSGQLRKVDIMGRYGGDEFLILLPETNAASARNVAERLRHSIVNEPMETSQGPLNVTISVGLAALHESTMTVEQLVKRADQALYKAKESGRDRIYMEDDSR